VLVTLVKSLPQFWDCTTGLAWRDWIVLSAVEVLVMVA
jgi:hypothetical protein